MSDKDKTPNIPREEERTVFRPNPAPRRAAPPETPPLAAPPLDDRTVFRPSPNFRASGSQPAPAETPSAASPPQPPAEARRPAVVDTGLPHDDRTVFRPNPGGRKTPVAPPPSAASAETPSQLSAGAPRQAAVQSAEIRTPGDNPILRAAGPLLLMLGRLRASLVRAQPATLVPQFSEAILKFGNDLKEAGIAEEPASKAKYILCATADKVLASLPGEDRAAASKDSLMTRFFGEATSGQKVFSEIDAVKDDPAFYLVVELAHACLALGFQGGTRTTTTADALERDVQQDLYDVIQKAKARQSRYLSLRWEGQSIPSLAVRLHVPLWAVAGAVGLTLFLIFIGTRLWLGHSAERAAQTMITLNPPEAVTLARRTSVPPPVPAPQSPEQASQLDRIRQVLQPDIASGQLTLDTTPNQIIIRLPERILFQPGRTSLQASGETLLAHVADAIKSEEGAIRIIGNSDTTPVSNARFASNFEVSEAYAATVEGVLKQKLPQPNRVTSEGKGSDAPVATNDTLDGRQKNRRVDIVIPRKD